MTEGTLPFTESGADRGRFDLSNLDNSETKRTLNYMGNQVALVEGLRLTAHFPVERVGWLVVTDYDCPYEEAICFHLFDKNFQRLDFVAVGKMYCPGILLHLSAVGEREFSFEFPGDGDWHKLLIEPWVEGFLLKKNRWLKVTLANGEQSPFV